MERFAADAEERACMGDEEIREVDIEEGEVERDKA